jgi:hypothetical protein
MQTMARETWTDERLDHLNQRVGEGFQRTDERFDRLEGRFASFEGEFKAMNRTLIQVAGGLIGTMIVTCGAIVATQL